MEEAEQRKGEEMTKEEYIYERTERELEDGTRERGNGRWEERSMKKKKKVKRKNRKEQKGQKEKEDQEEKGEKGGKDQEEEEEEQDCEQQR